ncbi:HAD-IIIC family phosphatase [Streptomyces sp. OF3]|uniref:HAD-IIIC family phosphatase n=1 Tax=Streptomyces alkaliterrae TaxID=2213162 RepID=A0A7W3ZQ22_9ACTN|nr:HAD-IIIC family phosphatase [Streptomyces alkaliterrae]MBB1256107.1 HAD-IIIC family phosphatase [Streptomyces alkaliterrae]
MSADTALDAVRAIRDAGELAARWPELSTILATADVELTGRAGALLAAADHDAAHRANPELPLVDVLLTGSGTVSPLVPRLAGELARQQVVGRVTAGDPGGYALALAAPGAADVTLCLLDASAVFDRVPHTVWTVDDVSVACDELLAHLSALARSYTAGGGVLVLTTAPLWPQWADQILDLRERARLGAVWRRFNAALLELGTGAIEGVHVVDLDPIAATTGPARDPRLEIYAHVAYGDALLGALARRVAHLVRALRGRPRKCLVLDLDGTLWGGTLAESGGSGLDMAEGFRGESHRRFQRVAAQLGSQGVLLAVCSKNDPAEVDEVLRDHPDLLVRRDDFVTVVADWAPKVDTVGQVAERIGIGSDSLVFVDDSATETGLVRLKRPEIAVIDVDAREPATHADRLLAEGWFDSTAITEEDRARAGRYRTEGRRAEFRAGFSSLTDYLKELDTTLTLFAPGPGDVHRLAQLTQRTNQFNLTTLRLDEAAVRAALADPAVLVSPVRVGDRFGEHGVIGAAFLRRTGTRVEIDNLVMSCRVLGRGIESAWLRELLRWAAAHDATEVTAGYRPSPRNGRVATLYPDHGFTPLPDRGDGLHRYHHDLTTLPPAVEHLTVVSELPAPVPVGAHTEENR